MRLLNCQLNNYLLARLLSTIVRAGWVALRKDDKQFRAPYADFRNEVLAAIIHPFGAEAPKAFAPRVPADGWLAVITMSQDTSLAPTQGFEQELTERDPASW